MFNKTVRSIVVLAYNKSIEMKMSEEIKAQRSLPPRTDEVNAICAKVAERSGHVVANALAGTGKTTTILHSISDFKTAEARAYTCHGFGFRAWRYFLRGENIKVDDTNVKTKNVFQSITKYEYSNIDERDRLDLIFPAVESLVSLFKSQGFIAIKPEATDDDCNSLVDRYDISLPDDPDKFIAPTEIYDLARRTLRESNKQKTFINFDDMVYMPVLHKVSFYKNDLIYIDESQDLNPIRIALIERAAGDWSQCVFVGDRNQSIYGFTGADTEAMDSITTKFQATELPLSICWRCPVEVIKHVQRLVPEIKHAPNAINGSVGAIHPDDMYKNIESGDFVLCRTTAPVVQTCLQLIRRGKAATVRGRDIGKGLIVLAVKISKKRGNKSKELSTALNEYRVEQERKYSAPGQENKLQSTLDKVDTLIVLSEDCSTFDQLKKRIEKIFANDNDDDTKNIILCSTVHKSKGLESPNVYVICPELLPAPWAKQDWQKQQEINLQFVAETRSERNLFFVDSAAEKSAEVTAEKPKRVRKSKTVNPVSVLP